MKELNNYELEEVSGGKPKFLNVFAGALYGAISGALLGGPAGAAAGIFYGVSMAIAKEGAQGLSEMAHPELFKHG